VLEEGAIFCNRDRLHEVWRQITEADHLSLRSLGSSHRTDQLGLEPNTLQRAASFEIRKRTDRLSRTGKLHSDALKLLRAVDTGSTARFDIERRSVYGITAAISIGLLCFLNITRALQKCDDVCLRDRLIDAKLFWRCVDAGCSRVDFAREQVVDAS